MWDLKSFVIGMIELIRLRFHFIVTEEFSSSMENDIFLSHVGVGIFQMNEFFFHLFFPFPTQYFIAASRCTPH